MKSLHLCNIANVAYATCKLLAKENHPVELRCHDMKHLMSQPEWDDLELNPDDFKNENDFYQNSAVLNDYQRPDWYKSDELHQNSAIKQFGINKIIPGPIKNILRPYYYQSLHLRQYLYSRFLRPPANQQQQLLAQWHQRTRSLSRTAKRYGKEWALKPQDFFLYYPNTNWLVQQLEPEEIIFAYVLTPIYAMLWGNAPYISIEIGTMRDIPFDQTTHGKLLALAYRLSDYVLLTNPDVRQQAEKLGLQHYQFCPHPIDEDVYTVFPSQQDNALRQDLLQQFQAEHLLFAPARQNWEVKGNDKYLRAFAQLRQAGFKVALIIPGWGQEIKRSQQLCDELGISAFVQWISPLSERGLIKYFQACDIVLDQFQLGVFGLITPKALACGKPVITSYNDSINAWCFPHAPPIVPATSAEDVFFQAKHLLHNPETLHNVGQRSRQWMEQYHSSKQTVTILEAAMQQAQINFKRKS